MVTIVEELAAIEQATGRSTFVGVEDLPSPAALTDDTTLGELRRLLLARYPSATPPKVRETAERFCRSIEGSTFALVGERHTAHITKPMTGSRQTIFLIRELLFRLFGRNPDE